ncbi:hypothetical protein [Streptomyces sp. NPDC050564]|uniref:hypothetical protein n=1 Tax=Streptomyces sp. NPDC050564 TaxID=3365631 RepID=UPI00378E2E04
MVAEAERTGRGIALEDLTGIRERVRLRKPQRATHASWSFAQLGQGVVATRGAVNRPRPTPETRPWDRTQTQHHSQWRLLC